MSEERVRLIRDGQVVELVLTNGARGNVVDADSAARLRALVAEIGLLVTSGTGPTAVLLRAEGAHFCVGGDLRQFVSTGAGVRERIRGAADDIHTAILGLSRLPVPLVVAVQGAIAGGGMGLALTGDLVVASTNARFRMAYTAVGLTPDMGTTWLLPRVVGRRRALELTLTNRTVDAAEALSWGLVSRVVPEEDLEASARAIATDLSRGPAAALARAKALVLQGFDEPDQALQLQREADSIEAAVESAAAQEAIQAFLAR
jgi:2-(1,2-epoxy-1,2-dihydrophenyl)acetyl-CoA isomerase